MNDESGRVPKRGMSLPFLLSLLLFGAVLADRYFSQSGFIVSAAYRAQPLFLVGVVAMAVLLWLWVLAAARGRSERFDGPVESVRGSNGALQPLLATIFIVAGANFAYGHSIPKWANFLIAEDVATMSFAIAAAPALSKRGCGVAGASGPGFGEVRLCLPADLLASTKPGDVVAVTGAYSFFGLEPLTYAIVGVEMVQPRLTVRPAVASGLPPNAEPATSGGKSGKASKN
jgi:hypothetical protein